MQAPQILSQTTHTVIMKIEIYLQSTCHHIVQ